MDCNQNYPGKATTYKHSLPEVPKEDVRNNDKKQRHILSNLNSSNTNGSFTMADSKSFLSSHEILLIAQKQIFKEIFLFYHEIVCCVYSLELPHQGDSNKYTQQNQCVHLTYRYCIEDPRNFSKLLSNLLPDLAP